MSQDVEETLMNNLFNFYLAKYKSKSITEVEEHFISTLSLLVERGELQKESVMEFLDDKGIEGELKETPKPSYTYRSSSC